MFLNVTSQAEIEKNFRQIKVEWISKKFDFLRFYKNLTSIDEQDRENWLGIINVLDSKLTNFPDSKTSMKALLISYNILERESVMYSEMEDLNS